MRIQIGKVRFHASHSIRKDDGSHQINLVVSRDESRNVHACAAWLILSNDRMPFYTGVSVGRYVPEMNLDTLRSVDITIFKGKFKTRITRPRSPFGKLGV